ncbi:phosphotransferase [Caballeronia sp. LZ035]|uniref:phosphotransferase n=1 Tax=Caballeronia sp. LZ035 TaxID=3038568 RepID=UPI002857A74C|nr:phosphotransferase [Caballeronia sp. LZ035]MDR5756324.1 phosphotransferase [Caballeronia sp. LZ035]
MVTKQIRDALYSQFGEDFEKIKLVSNGYHKIFLLEKGREKFFLKVYSPPLPSAIDPKLEARLLQDLERRHVQGSVRVVASGAVAFDGGLPRDYIVCTEARGKGLVLNEEDFRAFGSSLATLHLQAHASATALLPKTSPVDYCEYASKMLADRDDPKACARLRRNLENAAKALEAASLEHAFIHGDARIDNARRSKLGVTFFDFEQASQGPTAFDLSTVAWWLNAASDGEQHRLWSACLRGYTEVNRAIAESLALLPELLIANEARALPLLSRVVGTKSRVWSSAITQLTDVTDRYEVDRLAVLPSGLRGTDWCTQ